MSRMQLLSLCLGFAASLCDATMLQSIPAALGASKTVPGDWWAQVEDQVFYAPPASLLGLSQNVSDYYYVQGAKSALTPKMKEHLVGSQGRWHIMHLPEGQSMLEVSAAQSCNGDRRSSVSSLMQLKSGAILSSSFPMYGLDSSYHHPLDSEGQALEKAAIAHVGHDTAMNYLEKLVSDAPTRSWSDKKDSVEIEGFLKKELEALGLHTCYHNFNYHDVYNPEATTLTNVIAHIPGTEDGAVIVGAHYDSRPFEGSAPGAEDNGSGVASLLAMAKAFTLAMGDKKPRKSVWFTLFAGEEPGLLGSKQFAKDLKEFALPDECTPPTSFLQTAQSSKFLRSKPRVVKKTFQASNYHAIIMDEIGWLSPKMKKPTVNLESYDSTKEVMDHLRHSSEDHNGALIEVVHSDNPFGSDHMPFLDNHIGAVLTINGDDEAYPHYHKKSDKIRNEDGTYNVDAGLMSMITKMNLGAMMRMAL